MARILCRSVNLILGGGVGLEGQGERDGEKESEGERLNIKNCVELSLGGGGIFSLNPLYPLPLPTSPPLYFLPNLPMPAIKPRTITNTLDRVQPRFQNPVQQNSTSRLQWRLRERRLREAMGYGDEFGVAELIKIIQEGCIVSHTHKYPLWKLHASPCSTTMSIG